MTDDNKPKTGEFYILRPDMRGSRGHGVVFENGKALRPPGQGLIRPPGGGFPALKEMPRLRYHKSKGTLPNDLDASFEGYWLVSEPLKQVFESVDAEAFAFAPVDFILDDGSQGPPHYLCDVVREIDALDEAASTVRVLTEGYSIRGKFYDLTGGAKLAFNKKMIGTAHIFRNPYAAPVFCDRVMRDALIESGFGKGRNSRGVWLRDAADN